MDAFSLRTLIDDILLIVRNNNISESEDLSRMQIASWILAYKKSLLKARKDRDKQSSEDIEEDTSLSELLETKGPLELVFEESFDKTTLFRRRTKNKIPTLLDKDKSNIVSVQDQDGCVIQYMSELRKHYHKFRKYTHEELTYWYENGYVYIHGTEDYGQLKYIFVTGLFSGDDDLDNPDLDEDDIKIPGWMIPDIKKSIMDNELSFMLQRISDDDNNSTLDGIKPQNQEPVRPNEK